MTDVHQFKLIIEDDEGRRSVVPVELGEVSIGRLDANTVRLKERNVSRHHARILCENNVIFAEDLDSFNGVWVNGTRLAGRQEVRDGDMIRIGDFQLELHGNTLNPRREDTTRRVTMSPESDTQPGFMAAEEPTVTAAKQVHLGEPTQITDAVPQSEQELTAVVRGGDVQQATRQTGMLPGPRARLTCVSTQFAGREYEIVREETVIGRTEDNDIGIDHRSVSRQHAKIVVSGRRFKIVDLQSANGTLVNGESYAQVDLKRGDLIELGHVKFRFVPAGEKYVLSSQEQAAVEGREQGFWSARSIIAGTVLSAILGLVAAWLMFGGIKEHPPAPNPQGNAAAKVKNDSEGEVESLMGQVRAALRQRQWRRAQTLANAVLALDPGDEDALGAVRQVDLETKAQHSYDTAKQQIDARNWSDAWNTLQEVPKDSVYDSQAQSLIAQVRPELVNERLNDCRIAIKAEDYDEAEQQLEEVEGLESGRKDAADLRTAIEDGRKHRAAQGSDKHKTGRSKGKDVGKSGSKIPSVAPLQALGAATVPTPTTTAGSKAADDSRNFYNDGVKALKAANNATKNSAAEKDLLKRAKDAFERCIFADKNAGACYRALGISYAESGNGAKAAHYYRQYLRVEPNAHDADQVRQLLQQYDAAQ